MLASRDVLLGRTTMMTERAAAAHLVEVEGIDLDTILLAFFNSSFRTFSNSLSNDRDDDGADDDDSTGVSVKHAQAHTRTLHTRG